VTIAPMSVLFLLFLYSTSIPLSDTRKPS